MKAEKNIRKWGLQDLETLGLAVAEEAGELAQAILQNKHEGAPAYRITKEAADLGALCLQVWAHMDHPNTERHAPSGAR
jgi:NTP pyrophosphatase (non-canonical NTP hydrolase)